MHRKLRYLVVGAGVVLIASAWAQVKNNPTEPGQAGSTPVGESYDCIIMPNRIVEVGSAAIGVLEAVRVDRSDQVKSGQVIAELDSGVEAAQVEIARLRANIDTEVRARRVTFRLQQNNRLRTDRLHATRAVAQQTREEADHDAQLSALRLRQAEEDKRLAELELIRAEQALARRVIKSPITGVVMERHKSEGERVESEPIVRLAELDPLRVEVVLPVERFGEIEDGMVAKVAPEHGPSGEFQAYVTAIDPVLDAASGTFGVQLTMANPEHRLPGGLRCALSFLPAVKPAPDLAAELSVDEPSTPVAVTETAAPSDAAGQTAKAASKARPSGSANAATRMADAAPQSASVKSAGSKTESSKAKTKTRPTSPALQEPPDDTAESVAANSVAAPLVAPSKAIAAVDQAVSADRSLLPPLPLLAEQTDGSSVAKSVESGTAQPPESGSIVEVPAVLVVDSAIGPLAADMPSEAAGATTCRSLGPFAEKGQAIRVQRELEARSISAQLRTKQQAIAHSFMVAVNGGALALDPKTIVERLRGAGVREYQVLTKRPGDVSIGVFKEFGSAESLARKMQGKGFLAQIVPRTQEQTRHFLTLNLPVEADFDTLLAPALKSSHLKKMSLSNCLDLLTAQL